MPRVFDEEAVTNRAILVLTREARRAQEGAERVRLVLDALALRRGVAVANELSDL